MTTFIALLRGINLGVHNRVRMEDLRALFETTGFSRARTYLQSGNIVFDFHEDDPEDLPVVISSEISRSLGISVEVILRNSDEIHRVIRNNPFSDIPKANPDKLYVTFLSGHPDFKPGGAARSGEEGLDRYIVSGREVYLYCPSGYGRTKFPNNFFEKKLGMTATTRNWKTVHALARIAEE